MYADILFISEFINDYLILSAVAYIGGYKKKRQRLLGAALCGAFISCMLTVFYRNLPDLLNLIAGILLCLIMIFLAFRPDTRSAAFRLFLYTYATAFIIGGINNFLLQRFPGLPTPLLFAGAYIMLKAGAFLIFFINVKGGKICRVSVKFENELKHFNALIDSGNLLFDRTSGLPVSIIDIDELEKDFNITGTISFNSLGCEKGTLELINVPYICIRYKGENKLIENAPLGLSKHKLSASDSYQMIISPNIINKMEM